jgi:lysophospholipase L1-like esterase
MMPVIDALKKRWPENRTINIVCHGHSVPAGYFATPAVDTFNAYPHLFHAGLKQRYPYAVVNVIVTAIGGENAEAGAERFERDVLVYRPDAVLIDYALNDRGIGLARAEAAWKRMISQALDAGCKVVLMTPTWDNSVNDEARASDWRELLAHAKQIRRLAGEFGAALCDSFAAFEEYVNQGGQVDELLSWSNHPNRAGHERVAKKLLEWF